MAYNPFNIFRRNQKAIFAVVTVIIMFVFVMSSGLGGGADFFDWLPRWLGKSSKGGEVLCKLDGNKIDESQIKALDFQRVMANQFMLLATQRAIDSLTNDEKERLNQVTDQQARNILTDARDAYSMMHNPQFRQFLGNPQFARFYRDKIVASNALASSPTAKPVEKEIVRIQQYREQLFFQLEQTRNNEYFFNAPNGTTSDLIDFMIWGKKADELGISFTADDIKQMIQHEFGGYLRKDGESSIVKALRDNYRNRFTEDGCLNAIGEEFRIRTAQSILLGPAMIYNRADKQYGGVPIFTPPFELFEFYREQMSPTDYLAVPVPVSGFISKVTGQPTEQELQKIYDDYRDVEPNPAKDTPGFKTPRQMKVDWVSATGAEPYYQKLAEESLKAGELQAKIGSMLTIPLPGVSAGWVAAATTPLVPKDLLLEVDSVRSDYTEKARDHGITIESDWTMPSYVTRLLDTSVIRPPSLAAALGGAISGSMTASGPLPGLGLFEGSVRAFELRDRIKVEATRFLGILPGPAVLATLTGSQASIKTLLPKPLSIETMQPELMKDLREQTARQLLLKDFETFKKEADKLSENGAAKDKGQARKYLDEFIAQRGWKRGGSERLDSEWTMEDDPGLAPLKAALDKSHPGNAYIPFGQQFFWTGEGQRGPRKPTTGTFTPDYYPRPPSPQESPAATPESVYMVWRTEDLPSKRGPSFSTAEGKALALAAWKRQQARDLAKSMAESLANTMRSSAGDTSETIDQNMRELANKLRNEITDPKAKDRVNVFPMLGVSPLTSQQMMGIQEFRLERTKDIPYPTTAMKDILLDQRTKPPKTTFILTDAPLDTYYVVTVQSRKPMTLEDFRWSVYTDFSSSAGGMSPMAMMRQEFMQRFDQEAVKKTRESVLGMLKQEFHFEATDEQKKKLEARDKNRGEM